MLSLLEQILKESPTFLVTPGAILPDQVNTYFTYPGQQFSSVAAASSSFYVDDDKGDTCGNGSSSRVTWFVHGKTVDLAERELRVLRRLKKRVVDLIRDELGEYEEEEDELRHKMEEQEVFQLGDRRQLRATQGVSEGRQRQRKELGRSLFRSQVF